MTLGDKDAYKAVPDDDEAAADPTGGKIDSDDTTSNGTAPNDEYEVSARRMRRERRRSYKAFKRDNKGFWMWFNLIIVLFSVLFQVGTYYVLEWSESDCGNLRLTLYCVIMLHGVNTFMGLLNLAGCETKCCNANMVCFFMIFELGSLLWMQVSYFMSQDRNCMQATPDLYFWLMGQILVVYCGLGIVICHFFRKFC